MCVFLERLSTLNMLNCTEQCQKKKKKKAKKTQTKTKQNKKQNKQKQTNKQTKKLVRPDTVKLGTTPVYIALVPGSFPLLYTGG